MSDFLKDIIKETGNEYAGLVSDGIDSADVTNFIDTGSYSFNALLSGSIYGGMPANKITAIAGEAATGKTFFALGICKAFLDKDPEAGIIYFESESAISKQMIEARGIDSKRMVIVPVATVQEFRNQSIKILDKYIEQTEKTKKPLMFVLDSLGMLSTTKEMEDTAAGKETRDMTRSQIVKSTFRVLTLKLGKANIPMIMTNHTYDVIGSMFPQKEMGGGSGLKYAASSIIYLSKRKDKEGTEVVGNIIHCKNFKSRLTKENAMIDVKLTYKTGLDKYYGLIELGEEAGIFKKVSTRYEMPDGSKVFGKNINDNPEKYFTKEVLDKIDEQAKRKFQYGSDEDE
jgi:RecA/RadA recombinase|tara:strand:- start:6361 stop:7389 length:1029 start_codon:yes stop_codon:yes gene_type:complete